MQYGTIVRGTFIERPNRFVAHVLINDVPETVHVKNTGRCRELLLPGARVILECSDNPARKTKYDLISVYKEGLGLVNIDSQAPNKVAAEWLKRQPDISFIKPEYTYGTSRLDFYFERKCNDMVKCLAEVKGVTLERNGIGYFPDAPTERGVKHLKELTGAVSRGFQCYLIFVIQMEGIDLVYPNTETHPEFGQALEQAAAAGVQVIYLGCRVRERELWVERVKTGYRMRED